MLQLHRIYTYSYKVHADEFNSKGSLCLQLIFEQFRKVCTQVGVRRETRKANVG